MIFITLGSQKFQFNRLLKKIDDLIENEIIDNNVFAQVGSSVYMPKNYEFTQFLDRNKFKEKMKKAEIVITHGGTGAIVGALKESKKVIAVPRNPDFNEHVDNHQFQIVKQFETMNYVCACYDIDLLDTKIKQVNEKKYAHYISSSHELINDIQIHLEDYNRLRKK